MIKETFNLIILDKSGSMSSIKNATLSGVNETIGTIRSSGRQTGITQLLTLVSFCSCNIDYIYNNVDIEEVKALTQNDYNPCCCTPLYDTIGSCCTRLKQQIGNREDMAVSVTIITDGYENASHEWSAMSVKQLIESLKAEGWMFAYIGANQDVEKVSFSIAIDNTMEFNATEEDTREMFRRERESRSSWVNRVKSAANISACINLNNNYFTPKKKPTGK